MDEFEILRLTSLILLALLTPGVAMSYAIFPKRELSVVERLGISSILGIVPAMILYFLDKNFNLPINLAVGFLVPAIVGISALIWSLRK